VKESDQRDILNFGGHNRIGIAPLEMSNGLSGETILDLPDIQ
jgi:hypothetical protein